MFQIACSFYFFMVSIQKIFKDQEEVAQTPFDKQSAGFRH